MVKYIYIYLIWVPSDPPIVGWVVVQQQFVVVSVSFVARIARQELEGRGVSAARGVRDGWRLVSGALETGRGSDQGHWK